MRDYASLKTQLLADLGFAELAQPDGHIYSDMDSGDAARVALANSFYKKLCPTGENSVAETNALKKFLAINDAVGSLPAEFQASNEAESCFYDYYKDNLRVALEPHETFGTFDLDFIREHMMVGPGAAQKADSDYMVSKLFESSISYINPDLIRLYRSALVETGFWCEAEMQRYQDYGFTKVQGGKLFFAPKNADISRVCCTEASLEMIIQKAVGAFIEARLGIFFRIYLEKQPDLNRELARIGSIDGSLGTIDLISASDSIGLTLVKRDLPNGVLKNTLLASRSEFAVLPDGSNVKLNMVSTMGNGFTFPLQTIIFASVVRAVYQVMGFPCIDPAKQFAVFGDDIIVRREAYEFTVRMLTKLGFSVNVGKSFNTGPFRESCGHDYIRGVNIRGVYVRSLETHQQVCSLVNRLHRWSATHDICLPRTIKLLLSWTRDMRVPVSEADDAGIHVPFNCTRPKLTNTYWFKYRSYKRRVKKREVNEPGSDKPPVNECGVAVGFLSGHIRRRDFLLSNLEDSVWKHDTSLSVSIRDRKGARARYQVVSKSLPFWDYLPAKKEEFKDWAVNGPKEDTDYRYPLEGVIFDRWKAIVEDSDRKSVV